MSGELQPDTAIEQSKLESVKVSGNQEVKLGERVIALAKMDNGLLHKGDGRKIIKIWPDGIEVEGCVGARFNPLQFRKADTGS